jgi:hypothetical protein
MSSARLILCEKTSRWAAAFRAAPAGGDLPLVECRGLSQCRDALRQSPASAVALEVSAANAAAMLDWLVQVRREHPRVAAIVLLDATIAASEPMWREAGAVGVLNSTRQVPSACRLLCRHLALAPAQDLGLREAIARRLPWASSASADFALS